MKVFSGPWLAHNHWGWSPWGIWQWFRWAFSFPYSLHGVEVSGSIPRRFTRILKIGFLCFKLGEVSEDYKGWFKGWKFSWRRIDGRK